MFEKMRKHYHEISELDTIQGWNETDWCPWGYMHPIQYALLYALRCIRHRRAVCPACGRFV